MKDKIKIGNKWIGEDCPCFIIAEIGQNHNGDMNIAKQLIDVAAYAGADAIKSAKRDIPSELTKEAYNKPYDWANSFGKTYGEHREFLELSEEQHKELSEYTESKGLIYFASVCDKKSVDVMNRIGTPLFKIASRDLTNIPLIEYVAKLKKPIILSTGMASEEDIDDAVKTIKKYHDEIVILHCVSQYPCEISKVNLGRMLNIKKRWNTIVGWSDHTSGILMPSAAALLGAKVVEKHITLARTMKGTDHVGSLEPLGIQKVVRDVRAIEIAIGSGEIDSEKNIIEGAKNRLSRSLVSLKSIKKGDILGEEHLTLKSPGNGIIWRERGQILGKRAKKDIAEDVILDGSMFE